MATTTWSYGAKGSGLLFDIVYDSGTGLISVNMLEGSMDLNALYVSDGDKTVDGEGVKYDGTIKIASSLNMNGTVETWDDMVFLNNAGLGGADQASYFLESGESYTLTQAQMDSLLAWSSLEGDNLSGLTMGVRASSVNGGDSIKAVMSEGVFDPGEPEGDFYISIGRLNPEGTSFGAWFDTDKDGVFDAGETEVGTEPAGFYGYTYSYSLKNVDFESGDYTVRFVDVVFHNGTSLVDEFTGAGLVINGFGADDHIIVDMQTNAGDWMGLAGLNYSGVTVIPESSPIGVISGDKTNLPGAFDYYSTLQQDLALKEDWYSPPLDTKTVLLDGRYARLYDGIKPTSNQSEDPYHYLQFEFRADYDTTEFYSQAEFDAAMPSPADSIRVDAIFYRPYEVRDNIEYLGGFNGNYGYLVNVVGVPLDDTNVEYMLPTFG
jgi:hypothetical protein